MLSLSCGDGRSRKSSADMKADGDGGHDIFWERGREEHVGE